MAARLARFSGAFCLHCFRPVNVLVHRSPLPYTCYTLQRLFNTSEEKQRGDKYNLNQRRKRRFRSEKIQDEMAPHKLETFKLDPLEDDIESPSSVNSTRRDALAATLQQAMTSLLESNDVEQELTDCDFEITNVKIAHDLGHVIFYWISENKDTTDLQQVTDILKRNENNLRLLLPSYHHLHVSPRVVFSHDKHVDYLANINVLLKETQEPHHKHDIRTQELHKKTNTFYIEESSKT